MLRTVLFNFLVLPLFFHSMARGTERADLSLDKAFDSLNSKVPMARYLGGGTSFIGGGLSALAGVALQMDGRSPIDETLIGFAGTAIGTAMAADGLTRIFGQASAERFAFHYRNFPSGKPKEYGGNRDKRQYGESVLEELAVEGRRSRWLRGSLDAMLAGCYWYLYARGPKTVDAKGNERGKEIYRQMIYPGIFFTALALYRFILSSPEERAWDAYREKNGREVSVEPSWGFTASFSSETPSLGAVIYF